MSGEMEEVKNALVHSSGHAISNRSAGLVRRGIDLLGETTWRTCEMSFKGNLSSLSPLGQIASDLPSFDEHVIEISNINNRIQTFELTAPPERSERNNTYAEEAYSFAWSPCGVYLVSGSDEYERALRLFNVKERRLVGCFGFHPDKWYQLTWSKCGEYIASTSFYPRRFKLWRVRWNSTRSQRKLETIDSIGEIDVDGLPDSEVYRYRGFLRFSNATFSRNSNFVAIIANGLPSTFDTILILEIPSLMEVHRIVCSGTVSDIEWSSDNKLLLFACNGKIYTTIIDVDQNQQVTRETDLNFTDCMCHPTLGFVAFARYTTVEHTVDDRTTTHEYIGGPISIRKLADLSIVSEFTLPSVVRDHCWSDDGNKLFVACRDGTLVQAELPVTLRQR